MASSAFGLFPLCLVARPFQADLRYKQKEGLSEVESEMPAMEKPDPACHMYLYLSLYHTCLSVLKFMHCSIACGLRIKSVKLERK